MAAIVWTTRAKAMRIKLYRNGVEPFYRARHINKRYKIIYWYDEPNDTVVIEDIWDTRRAPQNLTKRIYN